MQNHGLIGFRDGTDFLVLVVKIRAIRGIRLIRDSGGDGTDFTGASAYWWRSKIRAIRGIRLIRDSDRKEK